MQFRSGGKLLEHNVYWVLLMRRGGNKKVRCAAQRLTKIMLHYKYYQTKSLMTYWQWVVMPYNSVIYGEGRRVNFNSDELMCITLPQPDPVFPELQPGLSRLLRPSFYCHQTPLHQTITTAWIPFTWLDWLLWSGVRETNDSCGNLSQSDCWNDVITSHQTLRLHNACNQ